MKVDEGGQKGVFRFGGSPDGFARPAGSSSREFAPELKCCQAEGQVGYLRNLH